LEGRGPRFFTSGLFELHIPITTPSMESISSNSCFLCPGLALCYPHEFAVGQFYLGPLMVFRDHGSVLHYISLLFRRRARARRLFSPFLSPLFGLSRPSIFFFFDRISSKPMILVLVDSPTGPSTPSFAFPLLQFARLIVLSFFFFLFLLETKVWFRAPGLLALAINDLEQRLPPFRP